jgi:hypothetical protein
MEVYSCSSILYEILHCNLKTHWCFLKIILSSLGKRKEGPEVIHQISWLINLSIMNNYK